jgi:hypothetical protein
MLKQARPRIGSLCAPLTQTNKLVRLSPRMVPEGSRGEARLLLIVAILIISTAPLYAQALDMAKLKADAQKVVSIISSDKAKTQTFCQMEIVGKQIDEAIREKDDKKAQELAQKLSDLEKNLGPEYLALVESLRAVDLTSKDGQEIVSTFDNLDKSCPQ